MSRQLAEAIRCRYDDGCIRVAFPKGAVITDEQYAEIADRIVEWPPVDTSKVAKPVPIPPEADLIAAAEKAAAAQLKKGDN